MSLTLCGGRSLRGSTVRGHRDSGGARPGMSRTQRPSVKAQIGLRRAGKGRVDGAGSRGQVVERVQPGLREDGEEWYWLDLCSCMG